MRRSQTFTNDQCFEQKFEKYHNFSYENNHFYSREISQNIVWACYSNVLYVPVRGKYFIIGVCNGYREFLMEAKRLAVTKQRVSFG